MIVYQKTKIEFGNDILSNDIGKLISNQILSKTGKKVSPNEIRAFSNSLCFIDKVISDNEIPSNVNISIEYHLPQTSKRVDFIITGKNGNQENVIIIELKQWESSEVTVKDGVVKTRFQYGESETSHPSYQAWSYAAYLNSFNSTVNEEKITLIPCAYLHNYVPDNNITNSFYNNYIEKAPVFLKPDALKLREFIKKFIKEGDDSNIMFRIDNGKIKPTKSLADSLSSMLKGNKEFIMLDDQKVVYETAKQLAIQSSESNKNVLIVEGGPGTGKSVVAINLLVELTKRGIMSQYVTKTSAPREVYFEKLRGQKKLSELKNLFVGSGSFMHTPKNAINTLIVDEAHRLTKNTGFLKQGENQIMEIINSSLSSVFFIDEDQTVSVDDYGKISEIEKIATNLGAYVHKTKLDSQFRCNGSDGYIAWLDHILQIRETANTSLNSFDYEFDFRVFDNPIELRDEIFKINKINNKARIVAGYCWPWLSKKDSKAFDFTEKEFGFNMKWNMTDYGGKWIIDPNSVSEIGCIHTAQGLEVDYVGVILGNDILVRDNIVLVNPSARDTGDKTIFGWKNGKKTNPEFWENKIRTIIKNTYRTLMTRGMKGCYIYSTDEETREYFKKVSQKN